MSSLNLRAGGVANRRRSQRILLTVPIVVSGKLANEQYFTERTKTAVVNTHGALIFLRTSVLVGQELTIKNVMTGEEMACTVADIDPGKTGMPEVGVEFAQPSARCWRVSFPPADWSSRSPEAKRHAKADPSAAEPPLVNK